MEQGETPSEGPLGSAQNLVAEIRDQGDLERDLVRQVRNTSSCARPDTQLIVPGRPTPGREVA